MFAALAACLWGFTYSVSPAYLPALPLFDGGVRALLAGLALLLLARARTGDARPTRFGRHQALTGALIAGFFAFHFTSLFTLPGDLAAALQTLGPRWTIALLWCIAGIQPRPWLAASALLGAAGLALMVMFQAQQVNMLGVCAALISSLCLSSAGVVRTANTRSLQEGIRTTSQELLFAGALLLGLCVVSGQWPHRLEGQQVLALLGVGLLLTTLPFALWFQALSWIGPQHTTPFMLLLPVVAALVDGTFNHRYPSSLQLLGAVLAVMGIALSQSQASDSDRTGATTFAAPIRPKGTPEIALHPNDSGIRHQGIKSINFWCTHDPRWPKAAHRTALGTRPQSATGAKSPSVPLRHPHPCLRLPLGTGLPGAAGHAGPG